LAIQFARAGKPTRLWGRDAAQRALMRHVRVNARYLPEAPFPDGLSVADTEEEALEGASDVLIAVPSTGFRTLLTELQPQLPRRIYVAWATKGFEHDSGLLPHQVAREVLGSYFEGGPQPSPRLASR
jgi:glycerol-3-phosphate dehydrogenase (NAD(P)+)